MNIVILGAGKIGAYVAGVLSKEKHDVTLIDKDQKVLENLGRDIDAAILRAEAPNWKLFKDLAQHHPDLFFAATGDDETNLVASSIAKNLGFRKTIARIKTREYLNSSHFDLKNLFFTDHFLGAEVLAAQDLFHILLHTEDLAVEHFAHGAIQMRTFQVPEQWDQQDRPIKDLKLPEDLIIGLIRRTSSEILIPHGDDKIFPGDQITIVGEVKIMNQIHEIFHCSHHLIQSVVLIGGTLLAEHLAFFLLEQGIHVRIIDSDLMRCETLADLLPKATIINRDGRDFHMLKNERIANADALIACTNREGTNLLIAAIAKQLHCPKTIAVIANSSHAPILEKVGVLPAFAAQVNLANRVLAILYEETILSVASLCNDQIKVVELKVAPSSKLIGIPLSNLDIPKDLLIAVIQSQGKVMIGKGNRILHPGDTVIAICPPERIPQLPELFH